MENTQIGNLIERTSMRSVYKKLTFQGNVLFFEASKLLINRFIHLKRLDNVGIMYHYLLGLTNLNNCKFDRTDL